MLMLSITLSMIMKPRKKSSGKPAQKVQHKKFVEGTVVERKDGFLIVQFGKAGRKQLNYEICVQKGLIEFV